MEGDLEGRAVVLQIDATEPVGRELAHRYGLRSLPSFVVFAADGEEIYRDAGMPDIDGIKSAALSSRES